MVSVFKQMGMLVRSNILGFPIISSVIPLMELGFGSSRFYSYYIQPSGTFVSNACQDNRSPPSNNNSVAIFWDLDNKPPNSVPPYDAAIRLKRVATEFGTVKHMVAYANRHAFSYVPSWVRDQRSQRKMLDVMECRGIIEPQQPYECGVCGHKFKTNIKLQKHFKQLHQREHTKRMNRLDSLKGKRKGEFVAKIAKKEEKYKSVAKDMLIPKVGYGLAAELKRAGFWVRTVTDKPQAADVALEKHMMDCIRSGVKCLCLVSDDSDFARVLKEARVQNLRTVVVGDNSGALKRFADANFSWREVSSGQARKEAASTLGVWQDQDVLKRVEWTYKPGLYSDGSGPDDWEEEEEEEEEEKEEEEGEELEENYDASDDKLMSPAGRGSLEDKVKHRPWWKLVSDSEDASSSA